MSDVVAVADVAGNAVESPRQVEPDSAARKAGPSRPAAASVAPPVDPSRATAFSTFWEFAIAVNRSEAAALAIAGHDVTADIPIDGVELRRLLGLMWFRTVLARLSQDWRDRILNVLIDSASVPDHIVKLGRHPMHLHELTFEQLQEIGSKTMVPDWIRPDLDLLITVGRFWGADALKRFQFVDAPAHHEPSMMESLLDRFRG